MRDIYEKYWDAMFADALKKLGDLQFAEDCAQETFALLYEKTGSGVEFENEACLCTWLYRTNAVFAKEIKRKFMNEECTEEYAAGDLPDGSSVEEALVRKERAEALDTALRSIPVHHAIATVFRYGYDLSYKETARYLGNTKDAARKYSMRGLKELQDRLKQKGE